MNNSIPPFYIGQEVVANCNHSQGAFKTGDEFRIKSIEMSCHGYIVTVGIPQMRERTRCTVCGASKVNNSGEWIFKANRFSPKIEISAFISMKELADKQLELISAN